MSSSTPFAFDINDTGFDRKVLFTWRISAFKDNIYKKQFIQKQKRDCYSIWGGGGGEACLWAEKSFAYNYLLLQLKF